MAHKAAARHLKSKIWQRLAAGYFPPTQHCCCAAAAVAATATCNTCCATRAIAVLAAGGFEEEPRRRYRTRQDTARRAANRSRKQRSSSSNLKTGPNMPGPVRVLCGSDTGGMPHYLHACLLFSIKMHKANFVGKHATATGCLPL